MTTDNEQSAPRRRRSSTRKPAADSAVVLETTEQTVPRAIFSSPTINAPGEAETAAEATPAKPSRGRALRRSTAASADTATIAAEPQDENASSGEAQTADEATAPAARAPRRGRGRAAAAAPVNESAERAESEPADETSVAASEPPAPSPIQAAAEDSWEGDEAAPASPSDLALIQRAIAVDAGVSAAEPWDIDDDQAIAFDPTLGATADDDEYEDVIALEGEETAEGDDAANAPRRRRRRGRRGRGRGGATEANGEAVPAAEVSESPTPPAPTRAVAPASPAPAVARAEPAANGWTPILPSYVVEFEPLPPPTKRRPSRRPGSNAQPRFSAEEQREVDAFVAQDRPVLRPEPVEAAPLTEEEQRELEAARARPHRRRRGSGASKAVAAEAEGLQLTPEFAPLSAAPAVARGGNALEALIGRQNVILDTLMERQIALLRNIERALVQLDRRMSGASGASGSTPRTGVFVDVPNVMYAAERLGWTIDFGKLLLMLTRGRELVRASAYAPISDDPQMRLETQRFTQPFMGRGYRIVTKPLKRFADGTMKGNFDVEMAMDILTMADRLDVVCLISGDGDFARLVEMVEARGVRVEVAAFSASTSGDLRAVCDDFIDLTHKQRDIAV